MKKIILSIFLLVSMLTLINAATDTQTVDDTFQLNQVVNYAKPCFNNGTFCSAATTCNFTVVEPDGVILVDGRLGQNRGTTHNITFAVTEMGIHTVNMACNDGGMLGAETFYFEVTGSGLNDTVWFYIIVLAISFGVILLGFNFQDPWVIILGTFGLYFMGIYVLFNGIVGVKDLTTTWAIGIITLGLAAYISIRAGIEAMGK